MTSHRSGLWFLPLLLLSVVLPGNAFSMAPAPVTPSPGHQLGAQTNQAQGNPIGPAAGSPASKAIFDEFRISVLPGSDMDADHFETAAAKLLAHLRGTYHRSFIQRTGLTHVLLFSVARNQGVLVGGVAEGPVISLTAVDAAYRPVQDCAGISPGSADALNCSSFNRAVNTDFLAVFDHELMHVIDITGLNASSDDSRWTQAWYALNPRDFSYVGSGIKFITEGKIPGEQSPLSPFAYAPGFITAYATSSVMEDKAEVYALYFEDPRRFEAIASKDPVIAGKLKIIRAMLDELCSRGSSGSCVKPLPFR